MNFKIGDVVIWQERIGAIYEVVNEKKKLYKVLFTVTSNNFNTPYIFTIQGNNLKLKQEK